MNYPKILKVILTSLEDKKAEDIKVYKVNNSLCDYEVICSSINARNALAISSDIEEKLELNNFQIKHIEGKESMRRIVVDAYDVVVHIFNKEERTRINIDEIFE